MCPLRDALLTKDTFRNLSGFIYYIYMKNSAGLHTEMVCSSYPVGSYEAVYLRAVQGCRELGPVGANLLLVHISGFSQDCTWQIFIQEQQ